MFWWFHRGDEYMRYEAQEVPKDAFELTVVTPDGNVKVERFTDQGALKDRQVALGRQLEADGWTGPHGWNR
jgi:hypothetical protein